MMCVFDSMCQEQIEATKDSWYANTHALNKKVLESVLIRSRSCTKNEDLDKKKLKADLFLTFKQLALNSGL